MHSADLDGEPSRINPIKGSDRPDTNNLRCVSLYISVEGVRNDVRLAATRARKTQKHQVPRRDVALVWKNS